MMDRELALGSAEAFLSVFDIETCKITHSHQFQEISPLAYDFIVLDATNFLLAGDNGVFRTTNSEVIKQSFRGDYVVCI